VYILAWSSKPLPYDEALDATCHTLGCNWELIEGEKQILKITRGKG
jgi:hypothetical protein